jgi:hypothetical protein
MELMEPPNEEAQALAVNELYIVTEWLFFTASTVAAEL